jgi:hypothetical protein
MAENSQKTHINNIESLPSGDRLSMVRMLNKCGAPLKEECEIVDSWKLNLGPLINSRQYKQEPDKPQKIISMLGGDRLLIKGFKGSAGNPIIISRLNQVASVVAQCIGQPLILQ